MTGALKPLFDDQALALDMLRQSIVSGHRRPVMAAPTGMGKTVLAAHIVAGARRKHNRVCFCVPALSLVDQTFERFVENGIDAAEMGIIQADHPLRRPHAPIQIATAQTLARRDLPETDVVVIDEAHIRFRVYDDWMGKIGAPDNSSLAGPTDEPQAGLLADRARKPPKLFVGLTATPGAKAMGLYWDDLLRPTTIGELIERGRLSKFRVWAPSKPDLKGVRTLAGDYHEGDLGKAMNQPKLVGDIVANWLEKGRGRPTLCFATGCDHARALADRLGQAGVRTAYIDADTPADERAEIGRKLARGEVEVACNIGTLTTGVDWDVRCLILARPTKSTMLFTQIIGRGLRPAEGKDYLAILDHSDNHARLGMVTDIVWDELDDGKPKPKARAKPKEPPLPKECHACACLVPSHMSECPNCGEVKPKPVFVEGAGALALFNGERRPAAPAVQFTKRRAGESAADALIRLGPERCYRQIRYVQEERGRQDGWSAHKYRELFGTFPPRPWTGMEPEEACSLMRSWVRSQDIAWAKARDREVA